MRISTLARTLSLTALLSATTPFSAAALPEFLVEFTTEYPSTIGTRLESCDVCHDGLPPRRNPYGTDFNLAGRRFEQIESFDSDDDGFDNITEILALTFPGDDRDNPNAMPPTATATEVPTATPTPADTATPTHTRTPAATATIAPGPCYGDCNGDDTVAINELIISVRIALGEASVDSCSLIDDNGDGQASINELVRAVNRALLGCPMP